MINEFRQAIIDTGLTPPDYIEAGKFMRFAGEGKKSSNKAAWCKLFGNRQFGIFGDHSTGLSESWRADNHKTYTAAEKKAFAEERARAERERDQAKQEIQAEAAASANEKWQKCVPEVGLHKYLMTKNVQPYKIRNDGYKLVIPMYGQDRKLCSVQTIDPAGEKRFHLGGRTDGAYFPIGKPNGVMCIAEGYSTAASIHEATGHAVAVAFSCENLQAVAEIMSRKLPDTKFIICADDDHEKKFNVGMESAALAAVACGGVIAVPDFSDRKEGNTDFNDMSRLFGLDAVKAVINGAEKPAVGETPLATYAPGNSMSVIKRAVLGNLLTKIIPVDYIDVCKSLGWTPTQNADGSDKPPAQKHYKVAIIDQLMSVARNNNWHLIRDNGLSYIYTGGFWISLDKDELKNLLKDVAIRQGFPKINARDSLFINMLYEQSLQDGFFVERPLEKQSMINLNNCTLELNSDGVRIKEFDYTDFLTHQLPFDYEKEAVNTEFLGYLNDVLPNEATQKTLQEVCGYLFVKGLKLEKIFFLYGTGANGKSVLFEVLNGLIGDENISHYSLESLTDDTGYFRAKIKDKIVNYGTDIKLSRIDPGMFKTLASGEPIEARLPYCEPFTISDYAKLIFNVNRLDNANIEHTHGFYRRILIIPFNITIKDERQDRSLHKKILENKPGVLNWIIEGAERVIKNEDIHISQECRDFKAKFIKDTDSAALFIDAARYVTSGDSLVRLKSLYVEYKNFCNEDGYKPFGKTNFSKRLEANGYSKEANSNNDICFKLIRKSTTSMA